MLRLNCCRCPIISNIKSLLFVFFESIVRKITELH